TRRVIGVRRVRLGIGRRIRCRGGGIPAFDEEASLIVLVVHISTILQCIAGQVMGRKLAKVIVLELFVSEQIVVRVPVLGASDQMTVRIADMNSFISALVRDGYKIMRIVGATI